MVLVKSAESRGRRINKGLQECQPLIAGGGQSNAQAAPLDKGIQHNCTMNN